MATETDPTTVPTTETTPKLPKVEIIPKDTQTGRQTPEGAFRKGTLVAVREANSLSINSIGPLWVFEIHEPGTEDNGRIVRSFENPGPTVAAGNAGDATHPVWFRIKKMMRPDGVRIEVATEVTTTEPAEA